MGAAIEDKEVPYALVSKVNFNPLVQTVLMLIYLKAKNNTRNNRINNEIKWLTGPLD